MNFYKNDYVYDNDVDKLFCLRKPFRCSRERRHWICSYHCHRPFCLCLAFLRNIPLVAHAVQFSCASESAWFGSVPPCAGHREPCKWGNCSSPQCSYIFSGSGANSKTFHCAAIDITFVHYLLSWLYQREKLK
ncbi:uncharacterized protein Dyak_GE27790 [Drosophila yakuba]|uniref:Uncharacterized protein n=1 Tax=Drosophila yakuba TaxID=7245 RepID=A0A0R1E112_DROYA|nr:uncharacterized protein Dyak_GE27790 [Drosophila yakuba]